MIVEEMVYEISIRLKFTREEAQDILDAAATHYDGYVKQQARGGAMARQDGFIYTMYCQVQQNPDVAVKLRFREIDTMAKAMEMPATYSHQDTRARKLFNDLKDVLDKLNAEVVRLRPYLP